MPAITVAFAVKSGDFSRVLPYVAAQAIGSFAAAVVVWVFYLPHWQVTEDPAAKLAVFCTTPALRSYGSNLLSEIVGAITARSICPHRRPRSREILENPVGLTVIYVESQWPTWITVITIRNRKAERSRENAKRNMIMADDIRPTTG